MWVFVFLILKELILVWWGVLLFFYFERVVLIYKGLLIKFIWGLGFLKFRVGGSDLCLRVKIVLINLVIFAVVFKWLILFLRELIV